MNSEITNTPIVSNEIGDPAAVQQPQVAQEQRTQAPTTEAESAAKNPAASLQWLFRGR